MQSHRLAFFIFALVILMWGNAFSSTKPQTLAYVGEDTLTTRDLRIELNLMDMRGKEKKERKILPEPEAVLRRLIQNRLITQEGYRMGLNEEFTVHNQVNEAINARCMGVLLDSVALAVPTDSPNLQEARRLSVKNYIENLIVVYEVEIDSTLLRSLDYGSSDSEIQAQLRNSQEVLAVVPTGKLTVSSFSRIIRFTAFHGLVDKPDAAERRDRIFHEWVSEAVTIHEARRLKIRNKPMIQLYETRLERSLMLDETLKILLQVSFEPTEEEIKSFHEDHQDQFLRPAQVKMESLKFATEEAAINGRKRMQQGVKLSWIKNNMDQVIDGPPPFPLDWFEADKLNFEPDQIKVGTIPEPYAVPEGWVVARISEVQARVIIPLSECREKVLRMMRANTTQTQMKDIISQLEEAVEVTIEPDAEQLVANILIELENKQ